MGPLNQELLCKFPLMTIEKTNYDDISLEYKKSKTVPWRTFVERPSLLRLLGDVKGKRVLAVEDTSTTGGSVLTAVEALVEAGAIVVGVAVIVERGAEPKIKEAGYEYRAAYQLSDLGL